MTDQEIDAIIQTIRTMPEGQSELARTIFKAAADSLSLDKVANLTGHNATTLQNKQQSQNRLILRFTEKEISKMPKKFKQEYRVQGCTAHIRKRPSGKNTFSYQIRYRRNGYNVSASGKTIEEAKEKFLEKLNKVDRHGGPTKTNGVPNVSAISRNITSRNFTSAEFRRQRTRIRLTAITTTLSRYSVTRNSNRLMR